MNMLKDLGHTTNINATSIIHTHNFPLMLLLEAWNCGSDMERGTGKTHCQFKSMIQNKFAACQITHNFEDHTTTLRPPKKKHL